MKVLVVDDSAFIRKMMRKSIEACGCQVIEADCGQAALDLYPVENPDFVTLDMLMPVMEGPEVLDRLLLIDPNARVVVCTSNVQASAQEEMLAKGAVGFLNKPVKTDVLQRTINQIQEGIPHVTGSE